MLTPRQKFDKATAVLLRDFPFWGSLILNLQVKEQEGLKFKTMATNGVTLWFDPTYVENQDMTVLITDIAHEGGHVMFFHPTRRGNRDPDVWNMATDFAINGYLKESGFTLGEDYLYDHQYHGMDAEAIYDLLWEEPERRPENGCGCGGLEDHPSCSGHSDHDDEDSEQGPPEDTEGDGESEEGNGQEQEESAGDTEARTRTALAQAKAFAQACGKMPSGLEIAVEQVLNPRLNWEEILKQFMERCSADDYTWNSPSRNHSHLGLYLPSMQSESVQDFIFAVDTSGSTGPYIDRFSSEVNEALKAVDFKTVHIAYCDSIVQKVDSFGQNDRPIPFNFTGGGGTDFRPVFEWIEQEGLSPKGLVYLTDLDGPFPSNPPPFPVLWVVCGTRNVAPFGETIKIV